MKLKERFALIILIIIFILMFVWVPINKYYNNKDINYNKRYTIGYTTKTWRSKVGQNIDYMYRYKSVEYNWYGKYKIGVKYPNGRYYVAFSSKNPEDSYIMFDKAVPDSIKVVPSDGWVEIPR